MVTKVAIVTDSIASMPKETVEQYRLRIVPINIHFEGKIYRDGVDLTSAQAYKFLEKDPEHFASSPASIEEYVNSFIEATREAEGVLCITLSAKLSNIHNVARLAKEEAEKQNPGISIEVLDSQSAAVGEGLVVTAAARASSRGMNLGEVIKIARDVSNKVMVIGVMDTIQYVYRTGRIPKITAQIGSKLHIKPIFKISEGKIEIAGLLRNKEQAVDHALEMMHEIVGEEKIHAAVAHADVYDEGKELEDRIKNEFHCSELWLTDFSPIMAYATGSGTLAIAFYKD